MMKHAALVGRLSALLLVALLSRACGGEENGDPRVPPSTIINTKGFASDCVVDTDCVAVSAGDTCTPCLCANATIAKKDKAAYDKRYAELKAECPDSEGCSRICTDPKLACTSGVCELRVKDAAASD